MRYSNESQEKTNGVVYTPSDMADFVANEMIKYHVPLIEENVFIMDPAVGQGSLLIALIKALKCSGKSIYAVGYETNEDTAVTTTQELLRMFPDVKIDIRVGDFLEAVDKGTVGKYDYIIANPPYIRTQIMGSDKAQAIAEKLSLTGRVDIYYAFLVYTKRALKDDGIAGYITSNKFM